MKLKSNTEEIKLRGAYYTPYDLATSIVNKFISLSDYKNVLEPSCGDGVFIDAIIESGLRENTKITAVEINEEETTKLSVKYVNKSNIEIVHEDFFKFYLENISNSFDLILGNPPYIRYQYLTELQRDEMSKMLIHEGLIPNKLINSWVAFVVASTTLLSNNGTMAFVLPAELLQVVYARQLRELLITKYSEITLLTFTELIFSDIEQEVVVLIAKKGLKHKGIRVMQMTNVSDIDNIDINNVPFIKTNNTSEKWTKYFVDSSEISAISSIKKDARFKKFSDFAIINVGVTTGNNSYFSVTEETKINYDLSEVCIPLIGKSSHVHGIFYTKSDAEFNVKKGRRSYLVHFPENDILLKDGYKKYIEFGVSSEANTGYKCRIRDKWYVVPSIWIPDAFFLRRNNLYPKFVINKINAISTDTMHRIKFREGVNPNIVLLSYYNSISMTFTEINGRSYGGGVLEILPSEVGEIYLPIIDNINNTLLLETLKKVDDLFRQGTPIEVVMDLIDRVILIDMLGISDKTCKEFRNIWKKLQNRRLSRTH